MIRGENFGALQFAGGRATETIRERAAAVDVELPTCCLLPVVRLAEIRGGIQILLHVFDLFHG